jgi:hypothetical protein
MAVSLRLSVLGYNRIPGRALAAARWESSHCALSPIKYYLIYIVIALALPGQVPCGVTALGSNQELGLR